jgi:hypothetical protein
MAKPTGKQIAKVSATGGVLSGTTDAIFRANQDKMVPGYDKAVPDPENPGSTFMQHIPGHVENLHSAADVLGHAGRTALLVAGGLAVLPHVVPAAKSVAHFLGRQFRK